MIAATRSMLCSSWRTAAAPHSTHVSLTLPQRPWQRTLAASIVAKKGSNKTKTPNKANLPSKVRKKWEAVWDDVKYCSDRCRSNRPKVGSSTTSEEPGL